MKKWIITVTAIGMFIIPAYADIDCDAKYYKKLKQIESATTSELSDEVKSKYISQLEKAYQLCKEGKKEQAAEILAELNEEHDFNTVFSTHDGN